LRIIFAGTPGFAASHLQSLINTNRFDIVAVYSQPDSRTGRGKKLSPTPVKAVAERHHIPVFQPVSLKQDAEQAQLKTLNADLMVVVAYGVILPADVLAIPRYGCINVHASLLPRWRGAAPIERAIEAGDKESGITIMQMDEGLDTGAMLRKQVIPIAASDSGDSLREKMAVAGSKALIAVLDDYQNGPPKGEKQDDHLACYAKKLTKAEAEIDWQQSSTVLINKIRAFDSSNITYTLLDGERIKICSAGYPCSQATSLVQKTPGSIISASKEGILVACQDGAINLLELQLPGGKRLAVRDILNSKTSLFTPGKRFESAPRS
jgi:methionyl-tRNA formyltransferase